MQQLLHQSDVLKCHAVCRTGIEKYLTNLRWLAVLRQPARVQAPGAGQLDVTAARSPKAFRALPASDSMRTTIAGLRRVLRLIVPYLRNLLREFPRTPIASLGCQCRQIRKPPTREQNTHAPTHSPSERAKGDLV